MKVLAVSPGNNDDVTFSSYHFISLHSHAGCAMSGLIADSRTMVDRARVDAQNHWFVYNEAMSGERHSVSV